MENDVPPDPGRSGALRRWHHLGVTASALLSGCAHTVNLLHPTTPCYSGRHGAAATEERSAERLSFHAVTYNIEHSRRIDRAIDVLEHDALRRADLYALTEMDEEGVSQIARRLGLNYAYYPSVIYPATGRYYGPAILSPWPIERSWKVMLPHEGGWRRQRRTATAAILRLPSGRILTYSLHLEPAVRLSEGKRRDQIRAVLEDAAGFAGQVVIAGDLNSYGIGLLIEREGYRWLTKLVGPTVHRASWDHIFIKGAEPGARIRAGTVRARGVSDHRPVWATIDPGAPDSAAISDARRPPRSRLAGTAAHRTARGARRAPPCRESWRACPARLAPRPSASAPGAS